MTTLNIPLLELSQFASLPGSMIKPHWLKQPMSRTNLHGPKTFRAIGVQLNCLQHLHVWSLHLEMPNLQHHIGKSVSINHYENMPIQLY